jgi:hypothetical protein
MGPNHSPEFLVPSQFFLRLLHREYGLATEKPWPLLQAMSAILELSRCRIGRIERNRNRKYIHTSGDVTLSWVRKASGLR